MKKIVFLPILLIAMGCHKGEGETLETAYIDPTTLPQIYRYSFSRNGSSNVNMLEPTLLKESISYLYGRVKRANMLNEADFTSVMKYYTEGLYNISPQELIATSPLHIGNKASHEAYLRSLIEASAKIGGYSPYGAVVSTRSEEASPNQSGYLGENTGDLNLAFADEKGLVIAEVFDNALLGSLYLDKVLNYHLDERLLDNTALRTDHENVVLVSGHNYTALEHHWDMAYGYYTTFLKPLTQLHGIPMIKDSERILFEAFVLGRMELARYRYEAMHLHLKTIRQELSKVVATCAMNYLVGVNTLSNLKNHPQDAFYFLSKGYGLIYALQFTRTPSGEPYFTPSQVQELLDAMHQNNGLWENTRLLSPETTNGSLSNLANAIGKPFGVTANDLKR